MGILNQLLSPGWVVGGNTSISIYVWWVVAGKNQHIGGGERELLGGGWQESTSKRKTRKMRTMGLVK